MSQEQMLPPSSAGHKSTRGRKPGSTRKNKVPEHQNYEPVETPSVDGRYPYSQIEHMYQRQTSTPLVSRPARPMPTQSAYPYPNHQEKYQNIQYQNYFHDFANYKNFIPPNVTIPNGNNDLQSAYNVNHLNTQTSWPRPYGGYPIPQERRENQNIEKDYSGLTLPNGLSSDARYYFQMQREQLLERQRLAQLYDVRNATQQSNSTVPRTSADNNVQKQQYFSNSQNYSAPYTIPVPDPTMTIPSHQAYNSRQSVPYTPVNEFNYQRTEVQTNNNNFGRYQQAQQAIDYSQSSNPPSSDLNNYYPYLQQNRDNTQQSIPINGQQNPNKILPNQHQQNQNNPVYSQVQDLPLYGGVVYNNQPLAQQNNLDYNKLNTVLTNESALNSMLYYNQTGNTKINYNQPQIQEYQGIQSSDSENIMPSIGSHNNDTFESLYNGNGQSEVEEVTSTTHTPSTNNGNESFHILNLDNQSSTNIAARNTAEKPRTQSEKTALDYLDIGDRFNIFKSINNSENILSLFTEIMDKYDSSKDGNKESSVENKIVEEARKIKVENTTHVKRESAESDSNFVNGLIIKQEITFDSLRNSAGENQTVDPEIISLEFSDDETIDIQLNEGSIVNECVDVGYLEFSDDSPSSDRLVIDESASNFLITSKDTQRSFQDDFRDNFNSIDTNSYNNNIISNYNNGHSMGQSTFTEQLCKNHHGFLGFAPQHLKHNINQHK